MNYNYPVQQNGYNQSASYPPQRPSMYNQNPSYSQSTPYPQNPQYPPQQPQTYSQQNTGMPQMPTQNSQSGFNYSGLPFDVQNNAALNMGLNLGKQYIENQFQTVMPGVSSYWDTLKFYFKVSNKYVVQKLKVLLFPFKTRTWRRSGTTYTDTQGHMIVNYEPPNSDLNCPDLYIPLMSFITFALILSFLAGTKGKFSPEYLKSTLSTSFILINIEVLLIRSIIYFMSSTCSLIDLYALCLYKFVGLTVNELVRCLLNKYCYYIVFLYTGACMMIFMLKSINNMFSLKTENEREGRKRKNYLIFAISILQPVMMWFMDRSA